MINEEISKEAGQAAQTIITYTIKAAKESINLEKEIRKKWMIQYSRLYKIEDEVRKYVDVLLWLISRA